MEMVHYSGEFFKLFFVNLINTKPISILPLHCLHLVKQEPFSDKNCRSWIAWVKGLRD